MTPNRARQARAMYDTVQHTVQEIADTFGVSRPTIYRHLADSTAFLASDAASQQPGETPLINGVPPTELDVAAGPL